MGYLKVNSIESKKTKSIKIELKIKNKKIKLELDMASEISVMSKHEFERRFGRKEFSATKVMLRTFSVEKIKPLGIAKVKVDYQGQKKHLDLFVVEKRMSTLFI